MLAGRADRLLDLLGDDRGLPIRALLPVRGEQRYQRELAAVGRLLPRQRIGLVFGAGGAKGFAHLGALRVLRRIRLPQQSCADGLGAQ